MAEDLDPFVGRTAELAALRGVLADVGAGRPQTVLLTGPAGIGKTSLIEQFLSRGSRAPTVLRASGEQWEAFVAFGVIDQLLRAAGVRGGLLLASRQRALPPEEPVGVGAVAPRSPREARTAGCGDPADRRRPLGGCRLAQSGALRPPQAHDRARPESPGCEGRGREASARRPPTAGERHDRTLDFAWSHSGAARSRRSQRHSGYRSSALPTAQRLRDHTGGNPLYVRALLSEIPVDRWHTWQPLLPAPRAFVTQMVESAVRLQPGGECAHRGLFGDGCAVLAAHGRRIGPARRSRRRPRRGDRGWAAPEHRQGRHLGRRVSPSLGAGGRLRAREPDEPGPIAPRRVRAGRRPGCGTAPPGRRHHAAEWRDRRGARCLRPQGDAMGSLGERSVRAVRGQPDERRAGGARGATAACDRRHRQRRRPPAGLGVHAGRRQVRAGPAARRSAGLPGDPARPGRRGRGAPERRGGSGPTRRSIRTSPRCWRCGGRCTRWDDSAERRYRRVEPARRGTRAG